MSDGSFLEQMRINVVRRRQNILNQNEIISLLVTQRHHETAAQARTVLTTMYTHLATEIQILDRLEAAERKKPMNC